MRFTSPKMLFRVGTMLPLRDIGPKPSKYSGMCETRYVLWGLLSKSLPRDWSGQTHMKFSPIRSSVLFVVKSRARSMTFSRSMSPISSPTIQTINLTSSLPSEEGPQPSDSPSPASLPVGDLPPISARELSFSRASGPSGRKSFLMRYDLRSSTSRLGSLDWEVQQPIVAKCNKRFLCSRRRWKKFIDWERVAVALRWDDGMKLDDLDGIWIRTAIAVVLGRNPWARLYWSKSIFRSSYEAVFT